MKEVLLFTFFITLILPQGCKTDDKAAQQYNQIMSIHDVVMAKMGDLNKQEQTLSALLPDIQDSLQRSVVQYSIGELKEADDLMMDWMHQWRVQYDAVDKAAPEYLTFLKNQKKGIINVSDRIYHALEHAEKTLAKSKSNK